MNKSLFRQYCKQKLEKASKRCYAKDKKWFKLLKYATKPFKSILLYMPLVTEPNTLELIKYLKRQKKAIFVPFVEDRSFKMVPYRLPILNGLYNIKTCGKTIRNIIKIDLAIVPALGIDKTLRRIGFGKGMYDRFFADLKQRLPQIILTQRIACICKQDITQLHDVKGVCMITSQGFFYKGNVKNVDRVTNYGGYNGRRRLCRSKAHRCVKI